MVRGEIKITDHVTSPLSLDITAMEIPEAAQQWAKKGRSIYLKPPSK